MPWKQVRLTSIINLTIDIGWAPYPPLLLSISNDCEYDKNTTTTREKNPTTTSPFPSDQHDVAALATPPALVDSNSPSSLMTVLHPRAAAVLSPSDPSSSNNPRCSDSTVCDTDMSRPFLPIFTWKWELLKLSSSISVLLFLLSDKSSSLPTSTHSVVATKLPPPVVLNHFPFKAFLADLGVLLFRLSPSSVSREKSDESWLELHPKSAAWGRFWIAAATLYGVTAQVVSGWCTETWMTIWNLSPAQKNRQINSVASMQQRIVLVDRVDSLVSPTQRKILFSDNRCSYWAHHPQKWFKDLIISVSLMIFNVHGKLHLAVLQTEMNTGTYLVHSPGTNPRQFRANRSFVMCPTTRKAPNP